MLRLIKNSSESSRSNHSAEDTKTSQSDKCIHEKNGSCLCGCPCCDPCLIGACIGFWCLFSRCKSNRCENDCGYNQNNSLNSLYYY